MNKKNIRAIFECFQAQNPQPKTELLYRSPFELLIAVMLSAQATDVGVNKVTPALFLVANTPELMLVLGETRLKSMIKTIGLFNTKASNIIKTCGILVTQHHAQVPDTREALQKLPGVGRKTANVVLNTAFGLPTMAVDTHIFRVANRTGLATGKTPLVVERGLLKAIPEEFLNNAHHWLILHGRYVCVARKPRCSVCVIREFCEYPAKNG